MPTSEQIEKAARLRCPFCGSRGIDRNSSGHKECYCTNCGASGPKVKVDWNSRALTAAEGVKPRVKPLEWDNGFAHTGVGIFYRIFRQSEYVVLEKHDGAMTLKSAHEDIHDAKAAAQADYEARILSALQEVD